MISHSHHFPSGRHLGSKQLRPLARDSLVVGTHLDVHESYDMKITTRSKATFHICNILRQVKKFLTS